MIIRKRALSREINTDIVKKKKNSRSKLMLLQLMLTQSVLTFKKTAATLDEMTEVVVAFFYVCSVGVGVELLQTLSCKFNAKRIIYIFRSISAKLLIAPRYFYFFFALASVVPKLSVTNWEDEEIFKIH